MEDKETQELTVLLQRVMKLQFGVVHKCMEKYGFHRAQPGIILELSRCEGLTQVELANKLGVTPATISAMIKRMERDESLYRKRSEEDQRVTHIFLTTKGKEQSIRVREAIAYINEIAFENFSKDELEQTKKIFNKMIDNLREF